MTAEDDAILEAIFDHTDVLIACLDRDLRFVRVNRAYAAMEKRPPAFFVGKRHFDLYPHEENERIFLDVLRTGRAHTARAKPFEYARASERGTTYWDWSLVPLRMHGEVVGAVLTLLDVTSRLRAIEELQDREEVFRALYEQSPDAILLIDPARREVFGANSRISELLRAPPESLRGGDLAAPPPPELAALIDRIVELGDGRHEAVVRTVGGELRDVSVSSRAVEVARTTLLQSVLEDVTEEKRRREQLERSLAEKSALLREVHDRVKNNLQVISSLLHLQRAKVVDPAARRAFQESTDRILSMAMIHERLYRSDDLAEVRLDEYVGDLTRNLATTFDADRRGIDIVARVDPARVPIDVAVPLGLALNELIANALEHAFPEGRGRLLVTGGRSPEGGLQLAVEDDGVGLPEPLRADLGLRMVESLAAQLGAQLSFERRGGTRVVLDLPRSK